MSVIFTAIVNGIGRLAYAVSTVAEELGGRSLEFELSRDGEYLWNENNEYIFVGFSENGDFSTSIGLKTVSIGRRIGKVKYIPKSSVHRLVTSLDDYVLMYSGVDTAEVFKKQNKIKN